MTSDQPYSTLLSQGSVGQSDQLSCCRPQLPNPSCAIRHIPLSPTYHGPRPSRRWDEEEFGREEKRKVEDDNLMLWRAIFVYVVAKHVRKAEEGREAKEKREVRMMIEEPASPQNHPEVVSLWRTKQWTKMEEMYGLYTQTFNQGDWGAVGVPVKPTTNEGDIFQLPSRQASSRRLSGFREMGARVDEGGGQGLWWRRSKERTLSWAEHVAHGHLGKNVQGGVLSVFRRIHH